MTCREKLKIEHPSEVGSRFVGGCCGCPHHFGYLDKPKYCEPDTPKAINKCTKCWNREIPGTEETKEKDMELNEKFAKMTFAELVDTAAGYEKEIEELNNRLSALRGSIRLKIDRINDLEETLKNVEKDVTFYTNEIDKRNQRLDEKEAKIHDMQDTIDFQERHINRIEGELKLYKGMKVDTNKTDYTKPEKVEEPICMSVPSSAVIGKLNGIAGYPGTDEDSEVTFKLPEDAVSKLLGNDTKFGKECIIMPTDIYKDVLNKDLEEHMKKYRDQVNQYMYYSRFLGIPCVNTPSNPIPPVAKDYKAIGEHIHRKFTALKEAGFTEDQAMSLIPMWTDNEEN